jgi:hypothetical protein
MVTQSREGDPPSPPSETSAEQLAMNFQLYRYIRRLAPDNASFLCEGYIEGMNSKPPASATTESR